MLFLAESFLERLDGGRVPDVAQPLGGAGADGLAAVFQGDEDLRGLVRHGGEGGLCERAVGLAVAQRDVPQQRHESWR